jgi:lipoprotein NlpD
VNRAVLLAAGALLLGGCAELTRWESREPARPATPAATPPAAPAEFVPGVYVVQRGDTLIKIAFTYRLDWRDLVAWNRLSNPDRIYPGQRLRLTPPGTPVAPSGAAAPQPAPASPPAAGQPPAGTTRAAPAAPARAPAGSPPEWRWPVAGPTVWRFGESRRNPTGIGIGGVDGAPIRAAADGEVVYSGSGLIGYGKLIILKHNDSYLSAYGYNQALQVKEGEQVKSGQVIALMGRGPADRPLLHFEIRVDGKPVDPARLLPPP